MGNSQGEGVPGNNGDVNKNGKRFMNFLHQTDSVHLNGACRISGNLATQVASGLWTWQRSGYRSVIDYAVISKEHQHTVHSMHIDDKGVYSTNSDHNWIFVNVTDKFVLQKKASRIIPLKQRWDIKPDQDWSEYKKEIIKSIHDVDLRTIESMASSISSLILKSMHSAIGLKSGTKNHPKKLPPDLVVEFNRLHKCEKVWKSVSSGHDSSTSVKLAEDAYIAQKSKTHDMFNAHRSKLRSNIVEGCKGNSTLSRRNFWSYVSPNKKQSTEIEAVISPSSGMVKCSPHDIKCEVESHLTTVFQGSYYSIPDDDIINESCQFDHCYSKKQNKSSAGQPSDHPYSSNPSRCLPKYDSSSSLETDPRGFLDSDFTVTEVTELLRSLNNGKSHGWDRIPNESLKNLPSDMIDLITILFNRMKSSGSLPKDWNRGRVTLVHKYGQRELLSNYRPITVVISLCGLYSKLLNGRLMQVVEKHNLLGEIQNGFRPDRSAADNNFILGTIRWKAKAKRLKVHAAYIDISKAYDTVDRRVLWRRLSTLGIRGKFLAAIKSLYSNDCIDCNVNGVITRSIFLRRGLRQGCSLSPVLFALYIADVGASIYLSQLGFFIGRVCISGLLFADDLLLVSRTAHGLKKLLKLVKKGFDALKLTINCGKSNVISPEDHEWIISDNDSDSRLTLSQVSVYKYLGIMSYDSMFKTCSEKQKSCIKTAYNYKNSCIYVSKLGPDTVDIIHCTWLNIAIPAILSGCESVPFTESTIMEIEKIQSQVAKFALGVPINTPNVCAQSEMGMKSFRHQLYSRQLKYYFRILYLPSTRWVHQALLDHMEGGWCSPYLSYIASLRKHVGMFSAPSLPIQVKGLCYEYFLKTTNTCLDAYQWMPKMSSYARQPYVFENKWSSLITQFKLENEGLGNKHPVNGYPRKQFCPVCPTYDVLISGPHVLFFCSALDSLRRETGIKTFIESCTTNDLTWEETYFSYVNGLDSSKNAVPPNVHLERAKNMFLMRALWLSKWE